MMEPQNDTRRAMRYRRIERCLLIVVLIGQAALGAQLVIISRRQARIDHELQRYASAVQPVDAAMGAAGDAAAGAAPAPEGPSLVAGRRIGTTPTRAPLTRARRVLDDMDAFFAQVFTDFERIEKSFDVDERWRSLMVTPMLDMRESEASYDVYFSLPGLQPDHLDVMLEGRTLTIEATCAAPMSTQRDRRRATLRKRVRLPGPVGYADEASAVWTNGALRVTVPKAANTNPAPASTRLL